MKRVHATPILLGSFLLAIASIALAAPPTPLSKMTKAQKIQGQKFFGANSLNFSKIFKIYHPGPYWILHHAKQLQLTDAEKVNEGSLKVAMAKSTLSDNVVLQKAYMKYTADSKARNPSMRVIKKDIDMVGRAETNLAWEMVPYHIKGYSILTASQRATYRDLAHAEANSQMSE